MKSALAWLVLCGLAVPASAQAPADRPTRAALAMDAVARADAAGLRQNFTRILKENNRDAVETISAENALALFAGCTLARERKSGTDYVGVYSCPARQAVATGCDSGDLLLFTNDGDRATEIFIAEGRKLTAECAPPAPLPPSPFEADIAHSVAMALVKGAAADGSKLVAESAQIARTTKMPGSDFQIEYQGRGRQAFVEQADYLLAKLGKPKSVECSAESSLCKFAFSKPDRMLLAGMRTRNHQVEFVQFIYMTRDMALERMKAQAK